MHWIEVIEQSVVFKKMVVDPDGIVIRVFRTDRGRQSQLWLPETYKSEDLCLDLSLELHQKPVVLLKIDLSWMNTIQSIRGSRQG